MVYFCECLKMVAGYGNDRGLSAAFHPGRGNILDDDIHHREPSPVILLLIQPLGSSGKPIVILSVSNSDLNIY